MRRTTAIRGALFLALASALPVTAARAQPATPPAPAPQDDPARTAFEALPEPERKALQDALVWTGDYKSTTDGGYGRGTREALAAYAARTKLGAGVLEPPARAALLKQAEARKAAVLFRRVIDTRSGAALSLPTKILPRRTDTPTGSRWSDAQGAATLETFQSAGEGADLPRLFDALRAEAPGRRVTYRVLRPEFLVVTGEDPRGSFYTRAALGGDPGKPTVRGYTLVYARPMKPTFDTLSIAISNGFEPFPGAAGSVASSAGASPAPPAGPDGSAVVVGPGLALGVLPAACAAPRVGDRPGRVVRRDDATGLALIEAKHVTARALAPADRAPMAGEAVALFSARGADGKAELNVAPGDIGAGAAGGRARLSAALQEGVAGAAVFDRTGAWVGAVLAPPRAPRLVAGVTPRAAYAMAGGAEIAAFLKSAGAAPATSAPTGGTKTAGEIAGAARGAVLDVWCR